MRVLNTNLNQRQKKYSRFSVPGFRSGSIIKKLIATVYYCFIVVFMCTLTFTFAKGDFSGIGDVLLLVAVELVIFGIIATPVIVIGFSDHYDWHGIKLFLMIMVPICVLWTLGQWLCTMFSMPYIESVNPAERRIEEIVETEETAGSDASIDASVVEKEISEEDK